MKRILAASTTLVIILAISVSSCKKVEPDTETQSAVDNNICETEFTKSMSTVNGFAIKENGIKSLLDYTNGRSTGPMIYVDPADTLDGFPVTMIIDYGTTGVTDSIDHKVRKGSIVCEFSNYWHIVGSRVKVNFDNFSVNGITYACDSMKITHSNTSAFTHQVFRGKCICPSWNLEWSALRTFTQTAGAGDLDPYNDAYSLTGNASGVNREGKAYEVTISSPIVKRTSCSWIESGRMDLTPEGLATRSVDFGNGNCDNQATLIINGNTFSFSMN